jgi:hypothetical protein
MESSGGRADFRTLYREVPLLRDSDAPDNYDAVIRASIYAHSSAAKAYVKGNPDVFFKDRGTWAIRPDWKLRMIKAHAARPNSTYLVDLAFASMEIDEIRAVVGDKVKMRALLDRKVEELRALAK